MIDLHCHLLPGIDDGALDLEDAIELARQGAADGVTAICATPHIRHDHDVRIHELPTRVAAVQAALGAARVPVRVLPGGEVAETILAHVTDAELRDVSLGGGGRWILLEPAPGPLSAGLHDAVADLHRRGFGALVAHPERHLGADFHDRLRGLVAAGALVQATAAAVTDPDAGPAMRDLARDGLLHVLGSDAHTAQFGRPVALAAAAAALATCGWSAERLRWTVEVAPEAIVAGAPLEAPAVDM